MLGGGGLREASANSLGWQGNVMWHAGDTAHSAPTAQGSAAQALEQEYTSQIKSSSDHGVLYARKLLFHCRWRSQRSCFAAQQLRIRAFLNLRQPSQGSLLSACSSRDREKHRAFIIKGGISQHLDKHLHMAVGSAAVSFGGSGRNAAETQHLSPARSPAPSRAAVRWYGKLQQTSRARCEASRGGPVLGLSPGFAFPSLQPCHAPKSARDARSSRRTATARSEAPTQLPRPSTAAGRMARAAQPSPRPEGDALPPEEVAWRRRIAKLDLSPLSGFAPEQLFPGSTV